MDYQADNWADNRADNQVDNQADVIEKILRLFKEKKIWMKKSCIFFKKGGC